MAFYLREYGMQSLAGCDGGNDCCNTKNKCGKNEGDCDNDWDCFGNLKCGQGNGRDDNCPNMPGFSVLDDCCYDPNTSNLLFNRE